MISDILSKIFNISITQGAYPSKLKIAKIIPIYKAEDETDTNNYRPIELCYPTSTKSLKISLQKNGIFY